MSSKFNLWKLLNEYRVIIPIIQRDYAQGRKENDYIRKTFLKDIKNCLCSEQTKQLTLDFIYGNIECKNCDDKRFYPLDGQQRLTTLWLVYWYISFKAGNLSEDGERLKKFTYETRRSSRDFCMALCDKVDSAKGVNDNESIVDYIKSQTWFYSAWLQDPTISAMLRTLGGEGDNNIEKIFKQCDFNNLRLQLIKADSNPIQFELLKKIMNACLEEVFADKNIKLYYPFIKHWLSISLDLLNDMIPRLSTLHKALQIVRNLVLISSLLER